MTLRFAEEIMLLLLDDEEGRFLRVPDWSMRYALGGAVLMDLALEDRIDTDLEKLILVDSTPLGEDLLDPVLAEIAGEEGTHNARFWVERTAGHSDAIREAAVTRLVERGILERREDRFLWVFRSRRYPVVDGTAEQEVKLRIMELLFSEMIPTPRDVVIICLADACGIFAELLSRRELQHVMPRIQFLRRMDLIGRAVTDAVWDIEVSLAQAIRPHFG
ncbi:MAG: GPP34 family phosphoprotein [Gemmatimonadetes bacterium]|nr:GPP34 family phosphoprotein [Gemmatimonadota bacterium]